MEAHDHRVLGRRQDLFLFREESPGAAFWLPRGLVLLRLLEQTVRTVLHGAGYQEVRTPQVLSRGLWETSGHWDRFAGGMFTLSDGSGEEPSLALKPMSCPGHVLLYQARRRSYRELPLRLCEFGACHRDEPSGALMGLMRARAFTQDDAHVFCAEDQATAEIARVAAMLTETCALFGFDDLAVGLSTRPAVRAGTEAQWDRAEAILVEAAAGAGLNPVIQPGEGAFYGPKLEFALTDAAGRRWQCGTIQLDMVLPERFDLDYIDAAENRLRPVMIHHAILGSLERFLAILLEHCRGHLAPWLAPDQVVVASLGRDQAGAAEAVAARFRAAGLRATGDGRAESLPRKVAEAHAQGIPVTAVIGPREAAQGTLTLRWPGGQTETLYQEAAVARLRAFCAGPARSGQRSAA